MKKQNNRYRRGIAMEMAIGMMLFSVAFSLLLYTVSMLQIRSMKNDLADFEAKVKEYQAEDCKNGLEIPTDEEEYFSVNGKTYKVTKGDNGVEFTPVTTPQE